MINTCTVKSPSQSAMDNLLVKGRASGKALVVAGCVPQGDRHAKQLQGLSVIGERLHDALHDLSSFQVSGAPHRMLSPRLIFWRRCFDCPSLSCELVLCVAGVTQVDRVVEAVEETLKVRLRPHAVTMHDHSAEDLTTSADGSDVQGNTVHMLSKKSLPRLDLPKVPCSCKLLAGLQQLCWRAHACIGLDDESKEVAEAA